MKRHAQRTKRPHDMQKILACVALIQCPEYGIIEIFHGADDKETTGLVELCQVRFVFSQVLDFYRDVVSYVGKLAVKSFDKLGRVANTVEKIRIAERDMLGARGHLVPDVLYNDVAADDSENAFINWDDGAMAAKMFAAAAGFRRAHKAEAAAGDD
jgi:hypothetical protein